MDGAQGNRSERMGWQFDSVGERRSVSSGLKTVWLHHSTELSRSLWRAEERWAVGCHYRSAPGKIPEAFSHHLSASLTFLSKRQWIITAVKNYRLNTTYSARVHYSDSMKRLWQTKHSWFIDYATKHLCKHKYSIHTHYTHPNRIMYHISTLPKHPQVNKLFIGVLDHKCKQ